MKIAARRRLAVGALATSGALVAGLLIAPLANAGAGELSVVPAGVENTTASQTLTFTGNDVNQTSNDNANYAFGGTATFTRTGLPATFTVSIGATGIPSDTGSGSKSFTDVGNGLGADGPAAAGTYNVRSDGMVPTDTADTCDTCFTVLAPGAPTLTSVAPSSLRPGTDANRAIFSGNNFEAAARIDFFRNGQVDSTINANLEPVSEEQDPLTEGEDTDNDGITTRTQLTRNLVVATGSPAGARDVRVTLLDGRIATCTSCFFVAGQDLTGVTPVSAAFNDPGQGDTQLTFQGATTNGDMRLEFLGTVVGTTRESLNLVETNPSASNLQGTTITGTFNFSDAAPGTYQPVVRSADGVVNACTCRFTVQQRSTRTPTITAFDATGTETGSTQQAGTTKTFDITGTNFSKGAAVTVEGTGVTVTAIEFVNNTLLRATLQTAAGAGTGTARDVTVTLTDGKTTTRNDAYTVTAAPATQTPTPTSTATMTPTPTSTATGTANMQSRYVGLNTPVRVRDTRGPNLDQPRVTREVVVDLSGQISDSGATAAVLNVTVTTPSARGFVVAYPNGTAKPGTSNVNFERGQTQANEVTVRLPANRRVSLFVDSAQAHVIADLVGYFTTTQGQGGQVVTQAPTRVFDSRETSQPRRTGEVVVDLPQVATGTVDVILNVTVTGSRVTDPRRGRGFVVAYATGTQRPQTSNVNFDAGQQQANEVITRVGTGQNAKKVSLFIDSTVVGLIVDLVGYVHPQPQPGSQVFTALTTPQRALDTRNGTGTDRTGRRTGDVVLTLPSSIPSGATGVVLNVTATNGTDRGFVTVYPTGQARPNTSNVNFPVNLTQANEAVTGVNNQRQVTLFVGGAGSPSANLVVDVVGYFTAGPQPSASPTSGNGGGLPSCIPGTSICS